MGRLVPFKTSDSDARLHLIETAAMYGLKEEAKGLTEEQAKEVTAKLGGSMFDIVSRMEYMDKRLREFISGMTGAQNSTLITCVIINYVVELCESVADKDSTKDLIDAAYQKVMSSEIKRRVQKAIEEAVKDA